MIQRIRKNMIKINYLIFDKTENNYCYKKNH